MASKGGSPHTSCAGTQVTSLAVIGRQATGGGITVSEVKKQTKADANFAQAKKVAAEVDKWPDWKNAGFFRAEPSAKSTQTPSLPLRAPDTK